MALRRITVVGICSRDLLISSALYAEHLSADVLLKANRILSHVIESMQNQSDETWQAEPALINLL